jgi:hypothetical protein
MLTRFGRRILCYALTSWQPIALAPVHPSLLSLVRISNAEPKDLTRVNNLAKFWWTLAISFAGASIVGKAAVGTSGLQILQNRF